MKINYVNKMKGGRKKLFLRAGQIVIGSNVFSQPGTGKGGNTMRYEDFKEALK